MREPWRNIFGEAPASFADRVQSTLKDLEVKTLESKTPKRITKPVLAAAAAAALLLGAAGVAAASGWLPWSGGLRDNLNISDEQAAALLASEGTPVRFALASAAADGITITAEQSVADGNTVKIAFRVEGLGNLAKNTLPAFDDLEGITVTIDGQPAGACAYWFDGVMQNPENPREAYYVDGTPAIPDGPYFVQRNVQPDGSLEFDMDVMPTEANLEGGLFGKEIEIRLSGLRIVNFDLDTPDTPVADGPWVLRWTLEGSEDVRTVELSTPLGDTGAIVTGVSLSPLSAVVHYDFPYHATELTLFDPETGEPIFRYDFDPPPGLAGMVLADGTRYAPIFGGGSHASYDDDYVIYTETTELNRIIDPGEVTALLFYTGNPDKYYTVPLD